MSIFEKFANGIDNKSMNEAIKRAEENKGGDYQDVPAGCYEVALDKLELGQTKKGDLKLVAWFKILVGEFKGSMLFKNSVLNEEWQLDKAFQFLDQLKSGVEIEGSIKNDEDFDNYLADILEAVDAKGVEYGVEYTVNKNGFGDVKEIIQVFVD